MKSCVPRATCSSRPRLSRLRGTSGFGYKNGTCAPPPLTPTPRKCFMKLMGVFVGKFEGAPKMYQNGILWARIGFVFYP